VPDLNQTAAEIAADEKNKRSHRGKALKLLIERLKLDT
jgi:inosine/xanthosine triphosphate pyrophosphatase family protein